MKIAIKTSQALGKAWILKSGRGIRNSVHMHIVLESKMWYICSIDGARGKLSEITGSK